MLSATSKARLQGDVFPVLDRVFDLAHPDDRKDLVQEIRDYLSRIKAGAKQSVHDKHTNAATSSV